MREIAGANATICEIGGGVGQTAYWAQRFGLGPYTMIDLPHVNVLQGYYLLKSLPNDQVRLYGESVDNPRVTVWPYFEKHRIASNEVDIVFNQNYRYRKSTMPPRLTTSHGHGKSRGAGFTASTKRQLRLTRTQRFEPGGESDPKQNVVGALVAKAHGFRRVMRAPYWLRRGYTSELYQTLP